MNLENLKRVPGASSVTSVRFIKLARPEAVPGTDGNRSEPMGTDAFGRVHSLWSAVIGLAVRDAADENAKLRAEAREWLFGPGDDFEEVCSLADLEPDWVRRVARRKLGIRPPRAHAAGRAAGPGSLSRKRAAKSRTGGYPGKEAIHEAMPVPWMRRARHVWPLPEAHGSARDAAAPGGPRL